MDRYYVCLSTSLSTYLSICQMYRQVDREVDRQTGRQADRLLLLEINLRTPVDTFDYKKNIFPDTFIFPESCPQTKPCNMLK